MARVILVCCGVFAGWVSAQDDYFVGQQRLLFQIWGGYTDPDTDSEIYRFSEEELLFDASQLDGTQIFFNVFKQRNNWYSIGAGFSVFSESVRSESRDYVFDDGSPILQDTSLDTVWFGPLVMFTPFGAGETFGTKAWAPRMVVPYAQIGAGFMAWEFTQAGDFVDERDLTVFTDYFQDDSWAFSLRLALGLRFNLNRHMDVDMVYLHDHAEDDLGGDFEGFGDLDLSSNSAAIGFTFRL